MASAREWMGKLLLRTPKPLRSLRGVPLLGDWAHRLSRRFVPSNEKVWAQVEAGPARGLWLELDPRTGRDYLRGAAESAVQKVLAERLHPGMVFYDLGANIGLFSLLAARLVGPEGRVFSFEPDAVVAERLRRNIARNEFSNATVVESGVWSAACRVKFVPAGASSPDHGTGRLVEGTSIEGISIPCVALDDFVERAPAPDAIKCDVEGAEVEVLRGAGKLLASRHPWIVCEMHSQANARACREIFTRFGYSIENIDESHVLAVT